MAEKMVAAWKNLDDRDQNNKTLLHYAVLLFEEDAIEQLVRKGSPEVINAADKDGQTPLHLAVSAKRESIVKHLLNSGFNVDIFVKNNDGVTPFMLAFESGEMAIINAILDAFQRKYPLSDANIHEAVEDRDKYGWTTLHRVIIALRRFQPESFNKVVKMLINFMGDRLDLRALNGQTALDTAILAGELEIALLLLESGADSTIPDLFGRVALHHFAHVYNLQSDDEVKLAKELIAHTMTRHTAPLKQTLSGETSPPTPIENALNIRDSFGYTPLHVAVDAHNDAVALHFLKAGADPGILSKQGLNPFHIACKYDTCHQFIQYVVANFSSEFINQRDDVEGYTGLHWACQQGNEEIVRLLLATRPVDQNLTSHYGHTPLHAAINGGNSEILKLLLSSESADRSRNIPSHVGQTPFGHALIYGNDECIKTVLLHPRTTVQDVITAVEDNDLGMDDLEHLLNILSEEMALEIIDAVVRTCASGKPKLPDIWIRFARDPESRKRLYRPLHTLARCGRSDLIRELVCMGANTEELDEDGWTFTDILDKYGYTELNAIDGFPKAAAPKPYPEPVTFRLVSHGTSISVDNCRSHTLNPPCAGVKEVNYDPRESGPHWACLCTTTCIPPDVDSFYFEVHLVELAEDQ
ncbi:hypothetical protein VTH82DRAFT_3012 [Thermothelomyces myriococcoides]